MKRILCLHGHTQSAEILTRKTKLIQKLFKNTHSFVFINATVSLPPLSLEEPILSYSWLVPVSDDGVVKFTNYQNCIEYIDNIITQQGPFDGLFCFSQGAHIGITYLLSRQQHQFKFFIGVSGFFKRGEDDYFDPFLSELQYLKIDIPSLHVYGMTDEIIPPGMLFFFVVFLSKTYRSINKSTRFLYSRK